MTTASVYTMPWRVSIGFACALKSKGSLFALMLPFRTFNIHGTFPRFFMVENGVLQTKGRIGELLFTERFLGKLKTVLLCAANTHLDPLF